MRLFQTIQQKQRRLLLWGGLKLKLIFSITLIVIFSIGLLNYLITGLMERTVTAKAFEVSRMAIERVGDASFNAIVERTYENRVNMMEMLKETKEAQTAGLLDISIYALEKEGGANTFRYFGGFRETGKDLDDPVLVQKLLENREKTVIRELTTYREGEHTTEAYRLVRPVIFSFGGQNHVVGAAVLYYDRKAITEPVNEAERISALTTLLVLALAIAGAWWLSGRFSRPIRHLSEAAKRVAGNDLNVYLEIRTADEIEGLAGEFNSMVRGLRERERMQKFVSGSAMSAIQKDVQLELGGGHRVQTFLFTDIRGFTALSENRNPAEVIAIINFYLDLQTRIIRKHGGDIDKFVGDEIVATFEGDGDLIRAVAAAEEIQATIAEENRKRSGNGEVIVEVGAGINRGEVVVGNIGSSDRMDFTSIGAVVNMAARLCSKAAPGEILIFKKAYDEVNADLGARLAEPISVKGFSEPVEIVALRSNR